ncbi:MAG: hypothetical protein LBB90_03715, partial [Tannerella sp.]|nr:hypothetical protein [Tannerella sp.]
NDPEHKYNITPAGATREERVEALLTHLTEVMSAQTEADYFIFPVVLKYDLSQDSKEKQPKEYRIILNDLDTTLVDEDQNIIFPSGAIAELKGNEHQLLTWYMNSEEVYIDAMKGYGVSPFLKVGKLLEIIFENFGYRIESNPFISHRQLKKLVVLNNVMDTILSGTLHYSDLMPDMTVHDFLESLYNKFGLRWFVDSNAKTVRFHFLKDLLLPSGGSIDLNIFKTEEPAISCAPQRQLKLTANREVGKSGFGFTSETLYDTFEQFLKAYRYQFTDLNEEDSWIEGLSCVFNTFDSQYFIYENVETMDSESLSSSDFFDWDKKTPGLEYEEIQMSDLCLPFDFISRIGNILYYGANVKHHYSDIVVEGETPKEEENPARLAFSFGWGLTDYTASNRYNWFFASQINRDVHGHFMYDSEGKRYDLSLTINREDGLYNRFWKSYDAFLRHSNQEVKCNLRFTGAELVNLKTDRVMFLNLQPLIVEQLKFKLNAPSDSLNECTLRTLRLYRPYDLEAEQQIPVYSNQQYYWKVITVVKVPTLSPQYMEYGFGYGFYTTADGTEHDTRMLFILPPTQEQFQNQEQLSLVYNTVAKATGLPDVKVTTTATYAPAAIVYS